MILESINALKTKLLGSEATDGFILGKIKTLALINQALGSSSSSSSAVTAIELIDFALPGGITVLPTMAAAKVNFIATENTSYARNGDAPTIEIAAGSTVSLDLVANLNELSFSTPTPYTVTLEVYRT